MASSLSRLRVDERVISGTQRGAILAACRLRCTFIALHPAAPFRQRLRGLGQSQGMPSTTRVAGAAAGAGKRRLAFERGFAARAAQQRQQVARNRSVQGSSG